MAAKVFVKEPAGGRGVGGFGVAFRQATLGSGQCAAQHSQGGSWGTVR
jgi:hypothetical protein